MTDQPGRRNPPSDPTAERTSDPITDGEDILAQEESGRETARRTRDEQNTEDPVFPSDDATLKTQI